MRYVVSKSRQLWHTLPLFMFLRELRSGGIEGVREQARARREYAALFPGKVMRADRFAPVELLVRQVGDQLQAPRSASWCRFTTPRWTSSKSCWIPL